MELGAALVSDSGTWPLPEASGSFLDEDSEDKDIPKAQTLSIQDSYLVLYAQGQGVPGARSWLLQALGGQPWVMGRARDSGSGVWPRAQVCLFPSGWSHRGLWPWRSSECAGHGHPAFLPLPVLLLPPEVPFSLPSSLLGTDCICKAPSRPISFIKIPDWDSTSLICRCCPNSPHLSSCPSTARSVAPFGVNLHSALCPTPTRNGQSILPLLQFYNFLSLASVSPSVQCWKG